MRVILVRHAIAEERDETRRPDAERPLSERGRKRFRAVARGLGTAASGVDAVLSSPYARAWETAQLLHELAAWPTPQSCEALIDADPAALGALVSRYAGSVALVGHEPGISALASWLLGGPTPALGLSFRKGGAACLELERWEPGSAVLQWFVPPRLLRLLVAAPLSPARLTSMRRPSPPMPRRARR